jgi:hypothetical protein
VSNISEVMSNISAWLRENWVIATIVGASVLVGTGISVAELHANESLLTVFAGLTLVASVAIFAAAVTAAIYAKPAYDDAVSLRRPAELNIEDFSLIDGITELEPKDRGAEWPVYDTGQPRPRPVKLRVKIRNVGKRNSRCILNIQVPFECGLFPLDAPRLEHYLSSGENRYTLMPGVVALCRLSAAEGLIPSKMTITYTAEIALPDAAPEWDSGWPMRIVMRGVGNQQLAVNFAWWLS